MAKVKKSPAQKKKPARKGKPAAAKKTPARAKNVKSVKRVKPRPSKKPAAKTAKPVKPVKKASHKPITRISSRPAGIPEQMRDAALKILDERQAEDIVTFNLEGRSPVADYLIVASGRATRQIAAIAHYLDEAFTKLGVQRTRIEGLPEANWVLVDGGDVIVHLFLPQVRGFYNLEGIWDKRSTK